MQTRLGALLCASLLTLCASVANAATLSYQVAINTSSLVGNALAPFALDFQMIGGSPTSSSALITNVSFGAPQTTPSDPLPNTFGLASGTLGTSVSIGVDSSTFFSEFFQGFVPGSTLTFGLSVTTNANGPTPDSLAVKILYDDPGAPGLFPEIPTTGTGNALLLFSLNSANPTVQAFNGTGAFSGVSATAAAVPEPTTLLLLGAGLVSVSARRRRRGSDR